MHSLAHEETDDAQIEKIWILLFLEYRDM
jgi:hypothetical protein